VRTLLVSLLVAIATGLSGCADRTASTDDAESTTEQRLTIEVRVEHEGLHVEGTADAPDGTPVTLHVGRNVKFARDDVPRSTTVARGQAEVTAGRFEAALPSDESDLVFDANGKRYGKIQVVSDSVTACAQMRLDGAGRPIEAIATTAFPSPALHDLRVALGHPVRHRKTVGQPFCAV
jgi:hypothetical protein